MLSPLHRSLAEMFRRRPELAADLLSGLLGIAVPRHQEARAGPTEAPTTAIELHADAVALLHDGEEVVGAVVVEIQLRAEPDKRWAWPLYVASVHRRWQCPVTLLVVCPTDVVARRAAEPIDLGNGFVLRPAALGPSGFPTITDPGVATRSPELVVLTALAHAAEGGPPDTLAVLVHALSRIDGDQAVEYAALVHDALPDHARAHLEALLSVDPDAYARTFRTALARKWSAEAEARGRAEGEAQGRAAILLRILDRRGVHVTDEARARISSCTDLVLLEQWSDRALTASTVDEVFIRP